MREVLKQEQSFPPVYLDDLSERFYVITLLRCQSIMYDIRVFNLLEANLFMF